MDRMIATRLSRRAFVQQVAAAATVVALGGCGGHLASPTTPKVHRIGWLGITPTPVPDDERYTNMRRELRNLGYIEGQNLFIEFRNAVARPDQLPALAKELVDMQVELIIAATSGPALAAKNATTTVPIVFHGLNDPVSLGIVPSLSRPGTNITGVAGSGPEFEAKRLELLKETVPTVSRVALLHVGTDGGQRLRVQAAQDSAVALGIGRVEPIATNSPAELATALRILASQPPDAVIDVNPNTLYGTSREQLANSALFATLLEFLVEHRLPFLGAPYAARAGGLMGMGDDLTAGYRRFAAVVDRILKGAKPADIPVTVSSEFEIVLNLPMARRIGLTFPESVRRRATEVIQ